MWLMLFVLWLTFSLIAVWAIATSEPDPCDADWEFLERQQSKRASVPASSDPVAGFGFYARNPRPAATSKTEFERTSRLAPTPTESNESRDHELSHSDRHRYAGVPLHLLAEPRTGEARDQKQREDLHASETAARAKGA